MLDEPGLALLRQPLLEFVELLASVDGLEERPSADDRRVEGAVERDLLLEIVRDVPGAPAELHDVDEGARGVEQAFDLPQIQTLVDDVSEPGATRLARPLGHS